MQVHRPPQNPCRVLLPITRTAYDTGVALHSLADQLMAHGREVKVVKVRMEHQGLEFEVSPPAQETSGMEE